jgi:hypothetical protein
MFAHALPSELSEKRKSKVNFHKKQEFQVPTSPSFYCVFAVSNAIRRAAVYSTKVP